MAHRGAWGLDTRPEAGCPEISWGWGVRLLPTESGSFHPRYRGRITGRACQEHFAWDTGTSRETGKDRSPGRLVFTFTSVSPRNCRRGNRNCETRSPLSGTAEAEWSKVLRHCLGTFPLGHTSKSTQRTRHDKFRGENGPCHRR